MAKNRQLVNGTRAEAPRLRKPGGPAIGIRRGSRPWDHASVPQSCRQEGSTLQQAAWTGHPSSSGCCLAVPQAEPVCLCWSVHISSWPGCEGRRSVGHSGANKLCLASPSLCTHSPQPTGTPARAPLIPPPLLHSFRPRDVAGKMPRSIPT